MAELYRNTTIQLYDNLTMGDDLGIPTENVTAMSDDEFETFVDITLHEYLHELRMNSYLMECTYSVLHLKAKSLSPWSNPCSVMTL
ncbi:MAG: hypothetical protein R2741_09520 [Methanolobus sp.]